MGSCDGDPERLAHIGKIQSCGFLIALEEDVSRPSGLRVVGASDNVISRADLLGIGASAAIEILGSDLGRVFRAEWVGAVRRLVEHEKTAHKAQAGRISIRANQNTFEADITPGPSIRGAELRLEPGPREEDNVGGSITFSLVSSNPGVYLLELEPKHGSHGTQATGRDTPGLPQAIDLLNRLPVCSSPQATTAALSDALADAMPEYDRVMIYRFAKDGSGEVIHESIRLGSKLTSSYLNLWFPATDIPPIARELLKLKGVAFIADTRASGVPLSFSQERLASVDLSRSALRAPSECHLRYLRNMGVRASLVLPIIVDGRLWGNVTFHSYSKAVHPSAEERMLASALASVTAALISSHEREEAATTALSLSHKLRVLNLYARVNDFLSAEYQALLQILDVDTIILCEQSRNVTVYGNKDVALTVPECVELRNSEDVTSDTLLFRPMKAKGVAFFSVDTFVVAFLRGSVASHTKWAGNPDEPVDAKEPMHPRASFDLFMKTAVAAFKEWSPATVDLLNMVRHAISSKLHEDAVPAKQQETFAQVSHELRTPFHGVMGALEILETGQGSMNAEEQIEMIRSARRCGDSMMSTLDSILDIAKNRNNTEVAQARFVASSPISLTMAAMGPFASTESVSLVEDTGAAEDILEVIGDCGRMKGVVQNLVNNAIKFTPRGGQVRVSLATFDSLQDVTEWWDKEAGRFDARVWMGRPRTDPTIGGGPPQKVKWHVYCVEDSGVGVLPADLPHLVAPYRQVSRGATKLYAGTGLGLHICKGHVDAMLGALGIASTFTGMEEQAERGGTLFAAVLPLVVKGVRTPAILAPRDVGAASISCLHDVGSRKIAFLLVDDCKVNLKLLERKVRHYFKNSCGRGLEVKMHAAADGLVALDLQREIRNVSQHGDPVLAGIFMDIHMPNLDGVECTRRIRLLEAEKGWAPIAVIGCTADTTPDLHEAFKRAGGDDVISKPWHRGDVENACELMLAKLCGGGGC